MRARQFASTEAGKTDTGPGTMIVAVVGCFAIGFAALVAIPRVWPRYVQVPVASDAQPAHVTEVGTTAARPKPATTPTDTTLVTAIKPAGAAPAPQAITRTAPPRQ